jgi:hypothetical protein
MPAGLIANCLLSSGGERSSTSGVLAAMIVNEPTGFLVVVSSSRSDVAPPASGFAARNPAAGLSLDGTLPLGIAS